MNFGPTALRDPHPRSTPAGEGAASDDTEAANGGAEGKLQARRREARNEVAETGVARSGSETLVLRGEKRLCTCRCLLPKRQDCRTAVATGTVTSGPKGGTPARAPAPLGDGNHAVFRKTASISSLSASASRPDSSSLSVGGSAGTAAYPAPSRRKGPSDASVRLDSSRPRQHSTLDPHRAAFPGPIRSVAAGERWPRPS